MLKNQPFKLSSKNHVEETVESRDWEQNNTKLLENIKILQHQNVQLNNTIEKYNIFLEHQLFTKVRQNPD